jgi:hypothetical protein
MQISRDDDALHRPTLRWMERLARFGGVGRLADAIRANFLGREADGIYAALGIVRYTADANIAGVLRRRFGQVDGDAEVLQAPSMLLRTRFGDCDDQAILGAALAKELSLPYRYVLHKDLDKPTWHHVYLIVKDGRGWIPVDRVYGRGPGRAKPGVVVLFRPLEGDKMARSQFAVLSPLPTTSKRSAILDGLGQTATAAEPSAATKTSIGQWFNTNPIGQALTSGAATLITMFTGKYAAQTGVAPTAVAPTPAASGKPFPTGLVVGGIGVVGALLLMMKMRG